MSHGSPGICICHDCKQYILSPRFGKTPVCPHCGKITEPTTQTEVVEKYQLGPYYKFRLGFEHWEKIKLGPGYRCMACGDLMPDDKYQWQNCGCQDKNK